MRVPTDPMMRTMRTIRMMRTVVRASIVLWLGSACTPTEVQHSTSPAEPATSEPAAPAAPAVTHVPVVADATQPPVPAVHGAGCAEVIAFDATLAAMRVPAADIATARKILRSPTPDFSRSPEAQHVDKLRAALRDPMPALAHLLTDMDLGDAVAFTMFELDEARAAPLVFASMPASDRNVQGHSFDRFLRGAFGPTPPCWNAIVRDAAVRTLDATTNADAAVAALFALGVAGTRADIDLLRRYLAHPTSKPLPDIWQHRLREAATAALARQGDEPAIASLRHALDVSAATKLDREAAERRVAALDAAGFSRQRTLVPLLCRHLDAPGVPSDGHMLSPQPNAHAAMALGHAIDGTPPAEHADVEAWKKRCRDGLK